MTVTTQLDLGERVVWGRFGVINLACGTNFEPARIFQISLLCLWIVLMSRTPEPNFKSREMQDHKPQEKNSRLGGMYRSNAWQTQWHKHRHTAKIVSHIYVWFAWCLIWSKMHLLPDSWQVDAVLVFTLASATGPSSYGSLYQPAALDSCHTQERTNENPGSRLADSLIPLIRSFPPLPTSRQLAW